MKSDYRTFFQKTVRCLRASFSSEKQVEDVNNPMLQLKVDKAEQKEAAKRVEITKEEETDSQKKKIPEKDVVGFTKFFFIISLQIRMFLATLEESGKKFTAFLEEKKNFSTINAIKKVTNSFNFQLFINKTNFTG